MATMGTPTKDENGKWYQRWYPVEGDIRPEGLEMLCKGSGWEPVPLLAPIGSERAYRIPSTYTPPEGWYCVPDKETVQEGDRYSHWGGVKVRIDSNDGLVDETVGWNVRAAREKWLPDGGWVIRREPIQEQSCKSESVNTALEKVGSSSVCHDSTGQESGTSANNATAPVAWQFRKQPMERVVDHYRLLEVGTDTIRQGDMFWENGRWYLWDVTQFGQTLRIGCPCRRPVYATLPTRLEDVPNGRVFECRGQMFWKHGRSVGEWEPSTGYCNPNIGFPFNEHAVGVTITDYVAELGEVK